VVESLIISPKQTEMTRTNTHFYIIRYLFIPFLDEFLDVECNAQDLICNEQKFYVLLTVYNFPRNYKK